MGVDVYAAMPLSFHQSRNSGEKDKYPLTNKPFSKSVRNEQTICLRNYDTEYISPNISHNFLLDELTLKDNNQTITDKKLQLEQKNLLQERQITSVECPSESIKKKIDHSDTSKLLSTHHLDFPQSHMMNRGKDINDKPNLKKYQSTLLSTDGISFSYTAGSVSDILLMDGFTQDNIHQQILIRKSPGRGTRTSTCKNRGCSKNPIGSLHEGTHAHLISKKHTSTVSKICISESYYSKQSNILDPSSLVSDYSHRSQSLKPKFNLQTHSTNYQQRIFSSDFNIEWERSILHRDISHLIPLHPVSSLPHLQGNISFSPSSPVAPSTNGRSPPEVLKTLLRKKACLYEPSTSRAIALVTWLAGRNLALRYGYFSRQHLQAHVHNVVSKQIDSGIITRTKVNRCMQIILNSCFHYIIPRPDGKEEKGYEFQKHFANTVIDDTYLLKSLPLPWHDLESNVKSLIEADIDTFVWSNKCEEENTPGQIIFIKNTEEGKCSSLVSTRRPVLLCFNENVRTAEDVLRCHNEFIRDAAISARLLLSADEWKSFFSTKGDDDGSRFPVTDVTAESTLSACGITNSPIIKKSDGCDIPHISFDIPADISNLLTLKDNVPEPWSKKADYLGKMNSVELAKFRTTWCCKRYDHNSALCSFAHASINMGWLRRNPMIFNYSEEICPHTNIVHEENILNECHLNACAKGVACKFAHSKEEIDFHPKLYKKNICGSGNTNFVYECKLRDICPRLHPDKQHKHVLAVVSKSSMSNSFKSYSDSNARLKTIHSFNSRHPEMVSNATIPDGAPILYLSPAPESYFDRSLLLPGMRGLYRRNCASHYAYRCGFSQHECTYSLFGDDWGLPMANVNLQKIDNASGSNVCRSKMI